MNSKKRRERKQIITLVITFAVIVALVVVYFIVVNVTRGDSEDTQPSLADIGDVGTFTIIDEDYTRITALSYTYNGQTVDLQIQDGKWTVSGDPDFPLDQEKIVLMSQAISDYGGYSRHTYDETRVSSYGTDDPLFDISATYFDSDGTTTYTNRYLIGNQNSVTGRYYFYETGSTYIYTVTDVIFPYFMYTLSDLLAAVEVPKPEVEDIISLTVEYDGGEYVYDSGTDTDLDIDADDSPVKLIMNAIPKSSHLQYPELVAYGVSESGLSEFGLDEPSMRITLKYKEYTSVSSSDGGSTAQMSRELEFTLLFGDAFTEGEGDDAREYVYVSEEGSDVVYKTEIDRYSEILAAAASVSGDADGD